MTAVVLGLQSSNYALSLRYTIIRHTQDVSLRPLTAFV
jgi:hypothetical protein